MPAIEDEVTTIRHTFDAPRDQVWEMWTDAEHLAKWWSPDGFMIPTSHVDVRSGGRIQLEMQGPDGQIYPMIGEYLTVARPERLVFTTTPLDADGKPLFEVLNTAVFTVEGDKTVLTLELRVLTATETAAPYLDGMEPGWAQSLGKLDRLLASA